MPRVDVALHTRKKNTISALRTDRLQWWTHWRDIADMYLPRRYVYLLSPNERRRTRRNTRILDSTGTIAARTLASGMMNGITSPSRQWFKLRLAGVGEDEPQAMREWLDQVERTLMQVMSESNFYNGLAVMYLDLVLFGTASMLIYEDNESVIRCYNPALGEYYLAQSARQQVNTFAREFNYKVHQVVEQWGLENCSDTVKNSWNMGGAQLQRDVSIVHLIEPNVGREGIVPARFPYRELYWEKASEAGLLLGARGFNELPGVFPRWDLTANEPYGGSPAMDAYGDVVQLQHETKVKGQALDKMVNPAMQADAQLQHKPTALLPRGITYISGLTNSSGGGIRPVHTVTPPLNEISQDLQQLQSRVREIFHNDLFRMISQLETVRSAEEIVELRGEKLVLLGPVLERFESEALDPGVIRIYNVANRAGLLPPIPEGFDDAEFDIQYVSVLSAAQRAVGTASIERFLQVVAQTSAIYPKALNVPDFEVLLRDYGRDIGVPTKGMRALDDIRARGDAQDQQEQAANEAAIANELAAGAATLSDADVGGGVNALQLATGRG